MLQLKEATAAKHSEAEKMPFNQRMFQGQLTKEEYALYLKQLMAVFQTFESSELPHSDLNRVKKVQIDLDEILSAIMYVPEILPATQRYVDYLSTLTNEDRLAHIYLNYLAILFGGQMMKKKVPSSGAMYEFDNPKEAIMAVRAVQKDEWADEVNRGFDFNIKIFEELENQSLLISLKSN